MSSLSPSPRSNNRRSRRRFVLTGARIAIKGRPDLLGCRIIDLSGKGARLQLPGADQLPDYFVLILSHDGRMRRQCAVAWRTPTAVGVEFVPPVPIETATVDAVK